MKLTVEDQLSVIDPIWPAPRVDDLTDVLTDFGICSEVHGVQLAGRMMTSGALVDLDDRRVFIKRLHTDIMNADELAAKHSAVCQIARHLDSPPHVPSYLCIRQGKTVVQRGSWVYEATEGFAGEDRYTSYHTWQPPALEDCRAIGRTVALVHDASAKIDVPEVPGKGFMVSGSMDLPTGGSTAREAFLAQRPRLVEWANQMGRDLARDLDEWGTRDLPAYAGLPRIWIHGDAHCSNIAFTGHEVETLFDFGLATVSTAVADVAMMIERNAIEWVEIMAGQEDAYRLDVAEELICGYEEIRPLTDAEREILPELMAITSVEPALNFIPYHLINGRESNAEWSYDVYFLGHARWFSTDPGQRFSAGLNKILTRR